MRLICAIALAMACGGCAGVKTKTTFTDSHATVQPKYGLVCMLAGGLPEGYAFTEIGRIRSTKGTYGGADQVEHAMADEARRIGADIIMNVQAEQRFKGPLPWRVTAPTGDGTAVRLSPDAPKLDCPSIGGHPL